MSEFKTYSNQTWLDISVYLYGVSDYAFELAFLNGYSVSDDIPAGSVIQVPEDKEKNRLVLLSLQSNESIPATALKNILPDTPEEKKEGIGYWIIGDDNIVQ